MTSEAGDPDKITREEVPAHAVRFLSEDRLLMLFSVRVGTYDKNHNLSRDRVVQNVAAEFRDDYRVNVIRILDDRNYMHTDGHKWNIGPFSEAEIRLFDPVTRGEMVDGGPADFRPGDIVVLDGGHYVILAADHRYTVGMDPGRTLSKHPTAVLRQLFEDDAADVRLVRSGEVVRENDEYLGE